MEIRHIKPLDNKNEISKIYERSWKFAYDGIIPEEYLNNIPKGHWISHLDNKDMHNLVLIENGKFI